MTRHIRTTRYYALEQLECRRLLCFDAPTHYAVGDAPMAIASGDFNGDGKADIAVSHDGANTLSILRNNGNGTFQSALNSPQSLPGARTLVAADFNNDGKLDLAVGTANVLRILLGNGNSTFAFLQDIGGGEAIAVGDFNHDGKVDLGVTYWSFECDGEGNCWPIAEAAVLIGGGNGTFTPGQPVRLIGTPPPSLTVADVNNDGKLDLLAANQTWPAGATVLLGNGDGTLAAPVEFAAGSSATAITSADLDADNKIDLIVANGNDATLTILLGNGNGTFQNHVDYGTGSRVLALAASDYDDDGRTDVLATDMYGNALALHRGNGDGTLSLPSFYDVGGASPIAGVSADFNNDGRLDAATANFNSDNVSVVLNDPDPYDKTWIGPSGGSWMSAGNWSPLGVPGWTDRVLIAGAASVTLNDSTSIGGLTLAGAARLTLSQNGDRSLRTQALSIAAGARLDLSDNDLIINYSGASPIGSWNGSAYTGVTGMIQSGRNGGAWNGSGIVTSMSNVGDGTIRALGVGEASAVLGISGAQTAMWNGVTVDATTVLVKYTYAGDIDLNGELNGDDYFFIDSHVLQSGSIFGYGVGDLDLDGDIDGDDYFWLDSNILAAQVIGPL